ncbi:MAG TPA: ATP-binding protein [Candidatus Acidoferrum sp.]|nr:ATP-binding protein [Candidatus Acidoferrum sp.]
MGSLVYVRLVGFTAGTLLQLFWLVVILGYRRQRNFERVFFFLCLALFLFYSGSLLALNAQIYYAVSPPLLEASAITLLCAGLCLLPPLMIHLHFEFAETRGLAPEHFWKRVVLVAGYAPIVYFALHYFPRIATAPGFDFLVPGNALGWGYGAWLAVALVVSAGWEVRFGAVAPDREQRLFHRTLAGLLAVATALVFYLHILQRPLSASASVLISTALAWLAIPPFTVLIYLVLRFNFLQIGRQKNLVYAALVTFLALLYLSLVRRVGVWLEPALPPEASAAILLFVLVIFIEPLQRVLGKKLQETAHKEMDRVQGLTREIQKEARQGNLADLTTFIERRAREQFELASAALTLRDSAEAELPPEPSRAGARRAFASGAENVFPMRQGGVWVGALRAEPHGAALSGETRAALEFLCEQLPASLDLCRLIEEKLQLERQLAERERLAVLGQMAASISHNLKNPLGSIKTILQVQLENPELPGGIRAETKMVLEEIERLSAKLNQLLRFSRPAVGGGPTQARCDVRVVIDDVLTVLRPEAEKRGVRLGSRMSEGESNVDASPEALHDVISNLAINALEASSKGGKVNVELSWLGLKCVVSVEDDGPGIPASLKEKVFEPFFTTKAQGTGLGLAIVAKRVAELGGELNLKSPINDGRGTRFEVSIWDAALRRNKRSPGPSPMQNRTLEET